MTDLLTLELTALLPLVVGTILSFYLLTKRKGPIVAALNGARKKKNPIVLFADMATMFKFYDVQRGFMGVFHTKSHDFMTDAQSVNSFENLTPLALASYHTAGTLGPRFLWENEKINEHYWKTQQKISSQAADDIKSLRKQEKNCRDVITLVDDITNQKITLEDAVTKVIMEKNLDPNDMATRETIKSYILEAKKDNAQLYKNELKKIEAKKNIPIEDEVKLRWSNGKPLLSAVAPITISLADYKHSVNIGSDADSVYTEIRDAAEEARLENETDEGKYAKWFVFGFTVFIILIGIYIVLTGLHLA